MITFKILIVDFAPNEDLAELLGASRVLYHSPLTNKEDSSGVSRHQVIKLVGQALCTLQATNLTSGNVDEDSLLIVSPSFVRVGEKGMVRR